MIERESFIDLWNIKVKDENFNPEENKGNCEIIHGTLIKENSWKLDSEGYRVATFVLPQGENTLDVTVTDEAGNPFRFPSNSDTSNSYPTFIVDTQGPNIEINISNEDIEKKYTNISNLKN